MRRRIRLAARLAPAVVACVAAGSCGHTGPPVAPLPRVPATPTDVIWQQRGDRLLVRARFRLESPGGRLKPPVQPLALVFEPPTPGLAAGWGAPSRAREFLRLAKAHAGEAFDAPEPGTPRVATVSVPVDAIESEGDVVVAAALSDRRGVSLPSGRVTLSLLRPPLSAPGSIDVVPSEEGVRVAWPAPADERVAAVVVFRSEDGEGDEWIPWRSVGADAAQLVDSGAEYGRRYGYAVAYSATREAPFLLSARTVTVSVDHVDAFPPRPPRDLDAVSSTGRLRVFWFEGGSADEAFVVVERQAGEDAAWEEVARVPVPDAYHEDRNVDPATRYRYRVRAVDASGNESPSTEPTAWMSPRSASEAGGR